MISVVGAAAVGLLPSAPRSPSDSFTARHADGTRLSRRLCCSALFAFPAVGTAETWLPKPLADARKQAMEKNRAGSVEYDPDKITILFQPTSELLLIQNAKRELDAVAVKVGEQGYKPNDEDRIAIFQLLGFSFKPTRLLMDKMLEKVPSAPLAALRASDRAKAVELASRFSGRLTALEDKNRERAPAADLAEEARGASRLLAEFLEVAATRYKVPELDAMTMERSVF